MSLAPTTNQSQLHGHVAVFYQTTTERTKVLARYFRDGLAHGELCILVSSEPSAEVIDKFQASGLDVRGAIHSGDLRLFEMLKTYLSAGQFVADYMLVNVKSFIDDARMLGYSGLRTAGEMSWPYDWPACHADNSSYDADVDEEGHNDQGFTGICLYPTQTATLTVLKSALKTHPAFMYNGNVHKSPYFNTRYMKQSILANDLQAFKALLDRDA